MVGSGLAETELFAGLQLGRGGDAVEAAELLDGHSVAGGDAAKCVATLYGVVCGCA